MSIGRWMDKENMVYMHSEILSSNKKNGILLCDSINGPRWYYAKWHRSDREGQIICLHL